LAGLVSIAGCGQNASSGGNATSNAATSDTNSTQNSGLKVGLLTPGDINDQGWNQLGYEGLQQVEKELGAQTSHQVTKNAADQQPAMRDYGDDKFNLVICYGFEYGERAKTIAPKFPETKFIVVGGNVQQEPNVATLVPKLEDATYLLGMVAGGMTKSNVIGFIGGMDLPVIKSTYIAFEQGAKAVNPKVKLLTNYIGNFEDQNAGKEAAKSMISQRADFLFHNADQAGKGMFVAAQEAGNVMVFGSNRNQNDVAPKQTLASAIINMPHAFVEVAKDVQANKFKAEFRELNLGNGNIGVEWNDALKSKVPPALMKKVQEAEAKIKSGQLKIKRNV
jgi:basic membrane lipoprotein Med (substrate-binding protein (PBP1-ABC) superfamily)